MLLTEITTQGVIDPLRGPWLKLDRGNELVLEFQERFYAWRKSSPYEVAVELSEDGTEQIAKIRRRSLFPEPLICIVADIMHNLHAALDYLAFTLATKIAG